MIHDKARTIILEGESWAMGAVWSAADYDKRPRNLYRFTRDQGFNPEATLVAHCPDASQVGWYEFESAEARPSRAGCLAQRLFDQVGRRSRDEFPLPSVVLLNLGECAWLAVLDGSGRMLSEHERWGEMAELRAYLLEDDVAGNINSFRKSDCFIENSDEAISWLFEGYRGRPLYAERLVPISHNAKIVAAAAGATIVLSGLAYHFHERNVEKQIQEEQQQAWIAHSKLLATDAANAKAAKQENEAFQAMLSNYWANYPRPWVGALSPEEAASACETYVTSRPQSVDGWERESASCAFTGLTMSVSENWKRGYLATVQSMPIGAIADSTGNVATDTMAVDLHVSHTAITSKSNLPGVADVSGRWTAAGQSNPDIVVIKTTNFTAFKPPVPAFVKQSKTQQVEAETPVLWMQSNVDLQSGYAPSGGWPNMKQRSFTVQSIKIAYQDNGIFWEMTGVQYAQ